MKKIILIFLIMYSGNIFSQEINNIAELEKGKCLKLFKLKDINYPGDSSYNVTYYKLNLNVSYSPHYLAGEVTASAKNLSNQLSSFYFDLSNILTVDSVKSGDESLLFEHIENRLIIYPDFPYSLDEEFSITIFYQGVPQSSSFVFDTHDGQPSIWTLSEPYGASDWWPCKDTPADKADSADILITCDYDFIAVSNGKLIETIDNRNGTYTYIWKSSYPIANYLISLAISNYTFYEQHFKYSPVDSMPVVHYIYPEIFSSVKEQLNKTIRMIEVYSEVFGLYPFIKEKYGHASFGRGGMEHQTISSMGFFSDGVISHELAHQWFGDKVTCKDWNNIWLNEGFATYSEGIFIEVDSGKKAYDSFIEYQMSLSKNAKGSIYVRNTGSVSEIFNGARSYSKGAVVLHMLRGVTGDSIFFRILKNYLNDPELAYGVAGTEDFRRVAGETYGSSLEYFFNQWIYGENYPKYFIDWNYSETGDNLYQVNISVSQTNNTYPQYFIMPLQFKIITNVKDTLITFFNYAQKDFFSFTVEGEPDSFIFDPDNLILKEVIINDPSGFYLPSGFLLEQNYPNPFNNKSTIVFEVSGRGIVSIKVYDILGSEAAVLFNEEVEAGRYEVEFDAEGLSSGIYFYKMIVPSHKFSKTKKLILLK